MTLSLGYKLSSEEQSPNDLVRHAQMAEDCGFAFALISDHFHPWTDRQDQVVKSVTCGPDPAKHLAAIRTYAEAGYDHVCVHQVGKEQKGFFEFYEQEIFPELKKIRPARRRSRRRRRG
jgi:hypothetical protein